MSDMAYIEKNLAAVKKEIAAAEKDAARIGKTTLIAAVKYADDKELRTLLSLGVHDVGENRVQQYLAHEALYRQTDVRVHFIGALQKNKVKYIVDKVHAIHSVDSIELAREIDKQAKKRGISVRVFVEVNSGREEAKSGVMPEDAEALCAGIRELENLTLCGLMTMAPHCEDKNDYHAYFAATKRLADKITQNLCLPVPLQLSMGMSESFDVAIAEGSDMVRVGRRLFGTASSDVKN